ncbi:hypothetical protein SUGI_0528840 [Cryptomeria japonica]|nr:hypothetical protein SUGI_0528840 [Cryptomeria japonica]
MILDMAMRISTQTVGERISHTLLLPPAVDVRAHFCLCFMCGCGPVWWEQLLWRLEFLFRDAHSLVDTEVARGDLSPIEVELDVVGFAWKPISIAEASGATRDVASGCVLVALSCSLWCHERCNV